MFNPDNKEQDIKLIGAVIAAFALIGLLAFLYMLWCAVLHYFGLSSEGWNLYRPGIGL